MASNKASREGSRDHSRENTSSSIHTIQSPLFSSPPFFQHGSTYALLAHPSSPKFQHAPGVQFTGQATDLNHEGPFQLEAGHPLIDVVESFSTELTNGHPETENYTRLLNGVCAIEDALAVAFATTHHDQRNFYQTHAQPGHQETSRNFGNRIVPELIEQLQISPHQLPAFIHMLAGEIRLTASHASWNTKTPNEGEWRHFLQQDIPTRMTTLWTTTQAKQPALFRWLSLSAGGNGECYPANSLINRSGLLQYGAYNLPPERLTQAADLLEPRLNVLHPDHPEKLPRPEHLILTTLLRYPGQDSEMLQQMETVFQLLQEGRLFEALDTTVNAFLNTRGGTHAKLDSKTVIETLKNLRNGLLQDAPHITLTHHQDTGYALGLNALKNTPDPQGPILRSILKTLQSDGVEIQDVSRIPKTVAAVALYPNSAFDWNKANYIMTKLREKYPGHSADWYLARLLVILPPPPKANPTWKTQKWDAMGPELSLSEFNRDWMRSHNRPNWISQPLWDAMTEDARWSYGGPTDTPFKSLEGRHALGFLALLARIDPRAISDFRTQAKQAIEWDDIPETFPKWLNTFDPTRNPIFSSYSVPYIDALWLPVLDQYKPSNLGGASPGDLGYCLLKLEKVFQRQRKLQASATKATLHTDQQRFVENLEYHAANPSPYYPFQLLIDLPKHFDSSPIGTIDRKAEKQIADQIANLLEGSISPDDELYFLLKDFEHQDSPKTILDEFTTISDVMLDRFSSTLPEYAPSLTGPLTYRGALIQALLGNKMVIPELVNHLESDDRSGLTLAHRLGQSLLPLTGPPYDEFKRTWGTALLNQKFRNPTPLSKEQTTLFPSFKQAQPSAVHITGYKPPPPGGIQPKLVAMAMAMHIPKNFDWNKVFIHKSTPAIVTELERIPDAIARDAKITVANHFFPALYRFFQQLSRHDVDTVITPFMLDWAPTMAILLQWVSPETLTPLLGPPGQPNEWNQFNKVLHILTGDVPRILNFPDINTLTFSLVSPMGRALQSLQERTPPLALYPDSSLDEFEQLCQELRNLNIAQSKEFPLQHVALWRESTKSPSKASNALSSHSFYRQNLESDPFVQWLKQIPGQHLLHPPPPVTTGKKVSLLASMNTGMMGIYLDLGGVVKRDMAALDRLTQQFNQVPTLPYALLFIAQRFESLGSYDLHAIEGAKQYAQTIRHKIAEGFLNIEGYPHPLLYRAYMFMQPTDRFKKRVTLYQDSNPRLLSHKEWTKLLAQIPPSQQTLNARLIRWMQGDPEGLVDAMPYLMAYDLDTPESPMNRGPFYVGDWLYANVEDNYYGFKPKPMDPNLTEYMVLFRHPMMQWWQQQAKTYDHFANGITYLNYFNVNGVASTQGKTIDLWESAANLSHSFRFWRFDTTGIKNKDGKEIHSPLFTQYGFQRIPYPKDNWTYGPGFILTRENRPQDWPLDPKTSVVFRRGYLLASNPDHGAILIRNSSKVFGRNLLEYPAYYTPVSNAPSRDELLEMSPSQEQFKKVVSPIDSHQLKGAWYPITDVRVADKRNPLNHALFLTGELTRLKEHYQHWKLDVSPNAMIPNPDPSTRHTNPQIFTGYRTEGFRAILDYYHALMTQRSQIDAATMSLSGKPTAALELQKKKAILPNLAFVDPDTPIYSTIPFYRPHWQGGAWHNVPADHLEMTQDILQELEYLVNGEWAPALYKGSPLIPFLQAGINAGAELVLLEPKKQTGEST